MRAIAARISAKPVAGATGAVVSSMMRPFPRGCAAPAASGQAIRFGVRWKPEGAKGAADRLAEEGDEPGGDLAGPSPRPLSRRA
jgi:hypothetical protein